MQILPFEKCHFKDALKIARENYEEEKKSVPCLPDAPVFPSLDGFAENGLGVAAFENGRMLGFLCGCSPWDNAFDSDVKGTFSPIHAHGAIAENRKRIWQILLQEAEKCWVQQEIYMHAIALYAHDEQALTAAFYDNFGARCMDAIRPISPVSCADAPAFAFSVLSREEIPDIRDMRWQLSCHLAQSPCFLFTREHEYQDWLRRAENRDTQVFAAKTAGVPVAFLEIGREGENFLTETEEMRSICGAYCLPQYRGQGVFASLLNFASREVEKTGATILGVDFETTNPTALGAWTKYFMPYTCSVVRRIEKF